MGKRYNSADATGNDMISFSLLDATDPIPPNPPMHWGEQKKLKSPFLRGI
jgi:hypothetical protein